MEKIYHVYWEGPFTLDELKSKASDNHVLYQIYGEHSSYGSEQLLYIGVTTGGMKKRFQKHKSWLENQSDECKIYLASVGEFYNWEENNNMGSYNKADVELVNNIERLLIYAHLPSYNTHCKKLENIPEDIRIFNTGRRKALCPEISSTYYDAKSS